MKKALVTGGAGFIGSHVVRSLLKADHDVKVFDNLSTGYKQNIEDLDIEFIQADIRDRHMMEKAMEKVDIVFHLAASIGNVKSLSNPREDSETNVLGTINVLEAARTHDVEKIVYSSSAAIFGEPLNDTIAEDHPQNPDSPYGVSKLAGEKLALTYGKNYSITVICLRYFNVFGPRQRYDAYGNVVPIFADRLTKRNALVIYGDGEQTRDFVNVKDVVLANMLAATRAAKSDVYNVGSGNSITIKHLASMLQEVAGIQTTIEFAPPRKGEIRHCRADISKIRREFGYTPGTDMRSDLKEYFDWFDLERQNLSS